MKELIKEMIFTMNRGKYKFQPVFIIGCGRSGTTILGKTLSKHPEIKYLNERRDIWHKAYPELNIWDERIDSILYADEQNFSDKKNKKIKKFFFREQVFNKSKILLEKLPINSFRLNFIKKNFPQAKYIYITRNGIEVSKSIEKKIEKQNWYKGKKFDLLKSFDLEKYEKLNIQKNIEKAMWEWRLSIKESDEFFKVEKNTFIHLSYQDFVNNPIKKISEIFDFLEIKYEKSFIYQISNKIKSKDSHNDIMNNEKLKKIGGTILKKTINNTYSPF